MWDMLSLLKGAVQIPSRGIRTGVFITYSRHSISSMTIIGTWHSLSFQRNYSPRKKALSIKILASKATLTLCEIGEGARGISTNLVGRVS